MHSPPAPREKRESSRCRQQLGKILLLPSPHQGFGNLRNPRTAHESPWKEKAQALSDRGPDTPWSARPGWLFLMGHFNYPQVRAVTAPPWHFLWLDFLRVAVDKGGNQAASVYQLVGLVTGFLTFPALKINIISFARLRELSVLVSMA